MKDADYLGLYFCIELTAGGGYVSPLAFSDDGSVVGLFECLLECQNLFVDWAFEGNITAFVVRYQVDF